MKLSIENVSKAYPGGSWGLSDFSLELAPGVLGLLGPNGAGKSTLMNILATITRPTAGRVTWDGTDAGRSPDAMREVLGYLPQDFGVYPQPQLRRVPRVHGRDQGPGTRAARAPDRGTARAREPDGREPTSRSGGFSGGMRSAWASPRPCSTTPSC